MTTAMVDNTMFNNSYSQVHLPYFNPMTGSNKKLKDGNNHWPSSTTSGTTTDNMWSHNPDNETPPTHGGGGVVQNEASRVQGNNPWGDDTHDSNWTSEDEIMNSDPLGEEMNDSDRLKRSEDGGGSEIDDLEIEGPTSQYTGMCPNIPGREGGVSHGGGGARLRNSDSDAMKDGVSPSAHVRDLQDEFLEGLGGDGGGGGLWRGHISRSSMGSTSSVNSAGSNSSWKGGSTGSRASNGNNNGANCYQRAASPRKHGRYENHRSSISATTSGKIVMKYPLKTKKHVADLDDAMELLQNEPGGWGNLPSPKPTEVDTGTEVWGIPDDIKVKMKKAPSGKGVIGSRGTGWGDHASSDEWGGKGGSSSSGWDQTPTGYVKGAINGSTDVGNQWVSNEPSWNAASKGNERVLAMKDNMKLLMDMGFLLGECEEMLCRNNNNFEAALGDLLALATIKEDEETPPELSPSNFPSPSASIRGLHPRKNGNSNRLSPSSSSHSEAASPRTTSPSFVQVAREHAFQTAGTDLQTSTTMGSTPATPTGHITTQDHLMQLFQQSQKLSQSMSVPQPSNNVNTSYILKVLNQQMKDYHGMKQHLMGQMKNLQSPKHQQMLTVRLNQVNTKIMQLKQHLLLTNQLAMQQQQKRFGTGSGEGKGPAMIKDTGTPGSLSQGSDGFGQEGQSTAGDVKGLGYSMQNMSLSRSGGSGVDTPTVSESSARTVSKLHKIISGSRESMNTDEFTYTDGHSVVFDEKQHGGGGELHPIGTRRSVPSPIGPSTPIFSTNAKIEMGDVTSVASTLTSAKTQQPPLPPPSTCASTSQTAASLTNSGKFSRSVDEIPEFKPGVPWNPNPMLPPQYPPFNQPKKMTHRSDNRPDSIPLSSNNNPYCSKESSPFVIGGGGPRSADMDYFPSPNDSLSGSFGSSSSSHMTQPQQYRHPLTSPGMGPSHRFGGSGNYPNNPPPASGFNTGGGYFNRQQSGHGFPRPSPQTPTGPMFPQNQFNPPPPLPPPGGRNRQRLYSQQSAGGSGYSEMGQRSRGGGGYDSGRKWSFDGNPWGVPEKTGNSIWSMDSTESLLSPSLSSEMGFSPSSEWKPPPPPPPGRKPSLPVNLTAPTKYVLLKNVTLQVDENSICEVCSEFGHIQNCSINMFNSTALICYRSREEAMQAKLGLEKNPIISGVSVLPSFASEKVVATFAEQRTPIHSYGLPPSRDPTTSSWLSSSDHVSSPQQRTISVGTRTPFNTNPMPPPPSRQEHLVKTEPTTSSVWGREFSAPGGPTMSAATNPSSVWSNRGILPGISTPWNAQSNTSTMPPAGGADDASSNLMGTSPSLSTLLPNDLF